MAVSLKIQSIMSKSSWTRRMFEEGLRLKSQFGAGKVYDFSLGNPILPPPDRFNQVLRDTVASCGPSGHCYMPQTGYPRVCCAVADYLNREQGIHLTADEVIMTCGAAGALNVIFKALLDPGDEVLTPSPCFSEYEFYADNHGGVLRTVPTRPDFTLDLEALEAAVNARTKVVLVNSPNNPTGQVYSEASLMALGELLRCRSRDLGRTIYLVSDEPYRKIVYDGVVVPSIFKVYEQSIVATSYSKDLSIAGERIGFAAVHPNARFKADIMGAMAMTIRILGFVNAPALMQRVVAELQGDSVDIGAYQRKRDLLCNGLSEAGYTFDIPAGAFYLFPRTPTEDDVGFVHELQEERILTVPGSGFGGPGHIRIAYCVEDQIIIDALPGFRRVLDKYLQRREQ